MTAKKDGGGGDETIHRDTGGQKLTPQVRRAAQKNSAKTAAETGVRAKKEIGGGDGPEPIRYGDWEVKGRVSDF
jgi:hypothetical protein